MLVTMSGCKAGRNLSAMRIGISNWKNNRLFPARWNSRPPTLQLRGYLLLSHQANQDSTLIHCEESLAAKNTEPQPGATVPIRSFVVPIRQVLHQLVVSDNRALRNPTASPQIDSNECREAQRDDL